MYNLNVTAVFDGGSKYEQTKELESGCEILVATPGRLIDFLKGKATSMACVTYLVLDEADRMFDMGFEPQVRSIVGQVRPTRQTLLFSATFKRKIEKLARDILMDPIRVVVGDIGEANDDITQVVEVFDEEHLKWQWPLSRVVQFQSAGNVLIFVTKKINAEELAKNFKMKDINVLLLHGDMNQFTRNEVLFNFKKQTTRIMIATDVAARGLDIPSIRTVVNYDVAKDIDTHTHRIGRTGRAGVKGMAYTLLLSKESNFAVDLVCILESAVQFVSYELLAVAKRNSGFRHSRGSTSGGYHAVAGNPGASPRVMGGGRGRGRGDVGGNPSRPNLQRDPDLAIRLHLLSHPGGLATSVRGVSQLISMQYLLSLDLLGPSSSDRPLPKRPMQGAGPTQVSLLHSHQLQMQSKVAGTRRS